ncbi:Uncharacterised protein [Neisseria gonorrhoeae]|nr:Uncharacterised protein [Neisseria gonorrhoeae]
MINVARMQTLAGNKMCLAQGMVERKPEFSRFFTHQFHLRNRKAGACLIRICTAYLCCHLLYARIGTIQTNILFRMHLFTQLLLTLTLENILLL